MKAIGIIPARMSSSRFPGKPMKKIYGIPMVGHCYLRSVMSKSLTDCYVATPDKEIYKYIKKIGGKAIMTSNKHIMCNDRVVEAVNKIEKNNKIKYDIVVNIQGDLPMVFPDMIDNLIKPLIMNQNIECSTMADPVLNEKEFNDPNRVKVIFDLNKNAILLTREPVPSNKKYNKNFNKFKHVAIRAYKRNIFRKISKLKLTPMEKIEGIDDLRLIENDIKIKIVFTNKLTDTVDNKKDLLRVIRLMKNDKLIKKYQNYYIDEKSISF